MSGKKRSTADKLAHFRKYVRGQDTESKGHHTAPGIRYGLRNFVAAHLTGIGKANLSNMARAGKFSKLDDGSYHTEQFERFIRARGDSSFSVPAGMRGSQFEKDVEEKEIAEQDGDAEWVDDPPILSGQIVEPGYSSGTNGVNGSTALALLEDDKVYELEHELIVLKVQSERLKVEQLTLRLKAEKGEYVPRSIIAKTVADAVVQFRESSRRIGTELAPSLVGMNDEYGIKQRIDMVMESLLARLQDQIQELLRNGVSRSTDTN
jgi:hypothetical protein